MNHLSDETLQRLADALLEGAEKAQAEAHCQACSGCAALLQEYRELCGGLEAIPVPPPPPRFTHQVMAAVEAREAALARQRKVALGTLVGSGALAALCFAIAGGGAWARQLSAFTTRSLQLGHVLHLVLDAARPVLLAWGLPLVLCAAVLCIPTLLALHRSVVPRPVSA